MSTKLKHAKYLGKAYPIYYQTEATHDSSTTKISAAIENSSIVVNCSEDTPHDINTLIQRLYEKEAKKLIKSRLDIYQPMIKVKYKGMTIASHPDKWGSCSSSRQLTFHWYLITFPLEVIDYVVVHELCHLMHMNHDRSFWRLVGKLCPDYKKIMPVLHGKE
jgi:predicted metal-dependent hydrolase